MKTCAEIGYTPQTEPKSGNGGLSSTFRGNSGTHESCEVQWSSMDVDRDPGVMEYVTVT